ncbi:MAG: hypothetical protein AAF153_02315 [Pseudomonadota bacterium]
MIYINLMNEIGNCLFIFAATIACITLAICASIAAIVCGFIYNPETTGYAIGIIFGLSCFGLNFLDLCNKTYSTNKCEQTVKILMGVVPALLAAYTIDALTSLDSMPIVPLLPH